MTRPPLLVRGAGRPLPATLLLIVYAALVLDWSQGAGVPWWLALCAVGAAMRTVSAVGRVRRYKAWLTEWNAMGATAEKSTVKEKRGGHRRLFLTTAALLLLAIPAGFGHLQGNEQWGTALTLLWIVDAVYLFAVVLRSIKRRRVKRPKAEPEAPAALVVEWMLGRASSSPSRSETARKLPEYSARLLSS